MDPYIYVYERNGFRGKFPPKFFHLQIKIASAHIHIQGTIQPSFRSIQWIVKKELWITDPYKYVYERNGFGGNFPQNEIIMP